MRGLLDRLPVRAKLAVGVGVFTVGLMVFGVFAYQQMERIKINGALYNEIVANKDLIADVLPPPAYLIESYLLVMEMLDENDPTRLEAFARRSEKLRSEYEARIEHWTRHLAEGPLRHALLEASQPPAAEFFRIRDAQFIPAILAGARSEAEALAADVLRVKYEEHRRAIDSVVDIANGEHVKEEAEARQIVDRARITLVVLGLFVVAVALLLSRIIAAAVSDPLQTIVAVFRNTVENDWNLSRRVEVRSQDEVGELAHWFNIFMEKLQTMVLHLKATAGSVAVASQQLADASEHLSTGSQQQASSLEQTAASLEQITGTVKHSADNAEEVRRLAVDSQRAAERGGQVVSATVESMREIGVASGKIAEIIGVVDEIAFQTNLLALNAAVEAARAGEHGRGFAVVATEVRNLAQRTSTAAKEIKQLIHQSVDKVERGSSLVDDSGRALTAIVETTKRVADVVNEIAAASREQATGIGQVNQALAQMDHVVQSTAAQTEELSATAQSLAHQATDLEAHVEQFKIAAEHPAARTPSATHRERSRPRARAAAGDGHAVTKPPATRHDPSDRTGTRTAAEPHAEF